MGSSLGATQVPESFQNSTPTGQELSITVSHLPPSPSHPLAVSWAAFFLQVKGRFQYFHVTLGPIRGNMQVPLKLDTSKEGGLEGESAEETKEEQGWR